MEQEALKVLRKAMVGIKRRNRRMKLYKPSDLSRAESFFTQFMHILSNCFAFHNGVTRKKPFSAAMIVKPT